MLTDHKELGAPEELSAYDIARRTGHHPQSIYQAIDRLGIKPSSQTPTGFKYYSASVVEILVSHMRRPRGEAK